MSEPILKTILYPPLGKTTVLPEGTKSVQFNLYLEATPASGTSIVPKGNFTALLWYRYTSQKGSPWGPQHFISLNEDIVRLQNKQHINGNGTVATYVTQMRLELPVRAEAVVEFCLKYRFGEGPWLWDGARVGGRNGKMIISQSGDIRITDVLPIGPEYKEDEVGEMHWISEWGSTPIADDVYCLRSFTDSKEWKPKTLGVPFQVERWMAITKIAAPWMGPQWSSSSTIDLSEREAIMVLYQRRDGRQVCLIPVSGLNGMGNRYIVTDTDSEKQGSLIVLPKDDGSSTILEVFVGIGGAEVVNNTLDAVREAFIVRKSSGVQLRDAWRDGLSYCTWNGLGPHLNEDKIFGVLKSLEKQNIKIANLIIDDNWQTLANNEYIASGTWSDFEANSNFKGGLKGLVSKIRKQFPYIVNIGVWHALHGYWDGITPESDFEAKYMCIDYLWKDNVRGIEKPLSLVAPHVIEKFYDDFYSFLKDSGVDCCKTDVQSRIDELSRGEDKKNLMPAYQLALKKASNKYLEGKSIFCMSHIPSILFQSLLGNHPNRKPVVRTSDDFYPSNPKTHPFHVFSNAMNQLLLTALDCEPDWDMFQTHDGANSELHAFARAFSSGSVFITDAPNMHNTGIIHALTARKRNSDALHTILPDAPARVLDPYHQFDSRHLFEMETSARGNTVSIFGVVNLSQVKVFSFFPTSKYNKGRGSVLHSFQHGILQGTKTKNIRTRSDKPKIRNLHLTLEPNRFDIITVLPLHQIGSVEFTVYGLVDRYIGAAAAKKVYMEGPIIVVETRYLGSFELFFFTGFKVKDVRVDGLSLPGSFFESGKDGLKVELLEYWVSLYGESGWDVDSGPDSICIAIELQL